MIGRSACVGVLVLAVSLSACATTARPTPTESPTATPTPIVTPVPETPSPTIAPTPDPTRPPTPKPRPTTNRSGLQLLPYYSQARQTFPLLPPVPQIDFDDPAGDEFDAQFRGLNAAGIPMFTVREDFVLTPRTAYHEIGHAYEAMLKWKTPSVDWRSRYWSFRGFPGTWQDAQTTSASQAAPPTQWIYSPAESWAEAFSISMVGGGQEKTLDYGRTINPVATKAFFQSLFP